MDPSGLLSTETLQAWSRTGAPTWGCGMGEAHRSEDEPVPALALSLSLGLSQGAHWALPAPSCGMWVTTDPLVHPHPLWVLQFVVLRLTPPNISVLGLIPPSFWGENPMFFIHAVQDMSWM